MSMPLVRTGLGIFALFSVGYPLSVWYRGASFAPDSTLLVTLFPAFGLLAFTIMYLHIIGRPFAVWLEQHVSFSRFERISSYVVLVSLILHPLLRTTFLIIKDISIWPPAAMQVPIALGVLGFLILITYDLGKAFYQSNFVTQHWPVIDLVSTLGFYVIWLHAFLIGSDVQAGFMRGLWIFYGATALLATLYVFVYPRFKKV